MSVGSAAWPVAVALYQAVRGDATLTTILAGERAYHGTAPASLTGEPEANPTPEPFVEIGSVSEIAATLFSSDLVRVTTPLRVYARTTAAVLGKERALTITGHIRRILHQRPLATTDGWRIMLGTITLEACEEDPDVPALWQASLTHTCLARYQP